MEHISIDLVMKILMLLFTCLLASSCHSQKKEETQADVRTDSILTMGGTKKLYMDAGDNLSQDHVSYGEADGKACLIRGNGREKTIEVYDYASGEKLSEVEVGNIDGEFFAYSSDTAFVVERSKGKATVSAWTQGNMATRHIPVRVRKGHIEQFPGCQTDGAIPMDGKWYFPCYRIGEYPEEMKSGKDRFPLMELDLTKKDYRFVGAYPEIYASNNMGTLNYWVPYLCRGKSNGEIVVGFKASPEMLVYSPATGECRFESVKSVYADTIPLPLTAKGRDYFVESDSYYYYAQYSHYGPISYDPWKKIYYRFVGIGLNDWELEPSPQLQNRKKWSVMVFDASFRKLGEQYLGDAYRVLAHFVSPDGLYLLNKGKEKGVAEYTLFTYNKE